MLMRIAVLACGDGDAVVWRAHHALLTLLAHAGGPSELVVATDRPACFRWFDGRVRVHALGEDDLAQWRGALGHAGRARIQLLRLAAALQPAADVVLGCDAASAAGADLSPIAAAARDGRPAMDRRRQLLVLARGREDRRLWRTIGGRTWAGQAVDERSAAWSTAAVAVGAGQFALLDRALAVGDAMQAGGVAHHDLPGLALGLVLAAEGSAVEINPAGRAPLVACYAGNLAAWDDAICRRLAAIHLQGLGIDAAIAHLAADPVRLALVWRTRWWHRLLGVEPRRDRPV